MLIVLALPANFPITALALCVAGAVVWLISHLLVTRRGFKDSPLHGVLCFILPPYTVYFMFARTWPRDRRLAVPLLLLGIILQLAGAVLLTLAK